MESDSVQRNLIETEFNSITAENIMKSMHIHPSRDTFNFDLPDKFVELGEKNIKINCYAIDKFFVEVVYDAQHNVFTEVKSFKYGHSLNKYAPRLE